MDLVSMSMNVEATYCVKYVAVRDVVAVFYVNDVVAVNRYQLQLV